MISPSMIKLTPEIEELNVTPSKTAQTIEVTTGIDGYGPVNVSAVDATIDSNIVPANIKKDVTILGVTGTHEGGGEGSEKMPTPVVDNGVLIATVTGSFDLQNATTIGYGALSTKAPQYAYDTPEGAHYNYSTKFLTSTLFKNASNVKKIQQQGCYNFIEGAEICHPDTRVSSDVMLGDLCNVEEIEKYGCYHMFMGYIGGPATLSTVEVNKFIKNLKKIDAYGMAGWSYYRPVAIKDNIYNISFDNLETVGDYALNSCFNEALYNNTSISFPKLSKVEGTQAFYSMLSNWTTYNKGTFSVYFPAITPYGLSQSVADPFNGLASGLSAYVEAYRQTLIVHFPYSTRNIISQLPSVNNKYGNSSAYVTVTTYFDLNMTSGEITKSVVGSKVYIDENLILDENSSYVEDIFDATDVAITVVSGNKICSFIHNFTDNPSLIIDDTLLNSFEYVTVSFESNVTDNIVNYNVTYNQTLKTPVPLNLPMFVTSSANTLQIRKNSAILQTVANCPTTGAMTLDKVITTINSNNNITVTVELFSLPITLTYTARELDALLLPKEEKEAYCSIVTVNDKEYLRISSNSTGYFKIARGLTTTVYNGTQMTITCDCGCSTEGSSYDWAYIVYGDNYEELSQTQVKNNTTNGGQYLWRANGEYSPTIRTLYNGIISDTAQKVISFGYATDANTWGKTDCIYVGDLSITFTMPAGE